MARLRRSFCLLPLVGCLLAAGCRGRSDLVEAELRTRNRDLNEMRDELYKTQAYNYALQREVETIRRGTPTSVTPEAASQTYTLQSINLGRGTGGFDDDNQPGDEALQVVVEPQDMDGHTIKAPGTLRVQAFEITNQGTKRPLCAWTIPPEELRRHWKSGLLSNGYQLVLPWKSWPATEQVRVVAQLTLADGRVYEKDKDVKIRLAPKYLRKSDGDEAPGVPIEIAPQPRKIDDPFQFDGGQGNLLGAPTTRQSAKPPAPSPNAGAIELLPPVPHRF